MEEPSKISLAQAGDVPATMFLRMKEMSSNLSLDQARVAPAVALTKMKEMSPNISLGQGGFVPTIILLVVSLTHIDIASPFPLPWSEADMRANRS